MSVMRLLCYAIGFTLILSDIHAQSEQAKLHQLFADLEEYEDQFKDQAFPDVLPVSQEKNADFLRSLIQKVEAIPITELNKGDRINHQVFQYILKNRLATIDLQLYLIPFNAEGGFYNRLGGLVRSTRIVDSASAEKYLEKIKAYPSYFNHNLTLMQLGITKGITAPKLIAENFRVLIEPFQKQIISENLLYQPFANQATFEGFEYYAERIADLIESEIIPLYDSFEVFMDHTYIPAARDGIAISEVTNGKEIYEQRIAYFTSLDMSPDEVYNKGVQEVARIRAEMEDIITDLDFKGTFADFLEFLRTDKQFYATSPRDLLKEASYVAKKVDGLLPRYFQNLPRLPYGVEPVPAALAPNYTGGRYSGGSWERKRAGQYWVNTYKLESRPLYVLPSLTLHEAVPGHHLQIALAQELPDMPSFRNREYISAFGEGWALYTEWLGKEMGIYETPYEDFGRLTYEMWRACRLVVDVGMHYKGWSRQQAFDFLSENTALSLHECNTEINRYIGWPGQAVSYKIGELKIKELRAHAEQVLGDQFDLPAFHDIILRNGSVPLFVLEDEVEQYIRKAIGP